VVLPEATGRPYGLNSTNSAVPMLMWTVAVFL